MTEQQLKREVRLWDVKSGQPIGEPIRHARNIARFAFSPNSNLLVTAGDSEDGSVAGEARVWDVRTGALFCPPLRFSFEIEKAVFSGNKEDQKAYSRYSGWVGGQKVENPRSVRASHPERLVERAVNGMIPHNRLGRQILKKLKVYAGDQHPHEAQSPEAYTAV